MANIETVLWWTVHPLWGPGAECLALIMKWHPNIVWGSAFEEFTWAACGDPNSDAQALLENINLEVAEENVNDSKCEASWRCPNGHRRWLLMRSWWFQPHRVIKSYVDKVSCFHKTFTGRTCDSSQISPLPMQLQGSKDRLDLQMYEVELQSKTAISCLWSHSHCNTDNWKPISLSLRHSFDCWCPFYLIPCWCHLLL